MAGVLHIEPNSYSVHRQSQLSQDADRIRHSTRVCVGPSPLFHLFRLQKASTSIHLYAHEAQLYVDLSGVRDGETAVAIYRVERYTDETVDVRP